MLSNNITNWILLISVVILAILAPLSIGITGLLSIILLCYLFSWHREWLYKHKLAKMLMLAAIIIIILWIVLFFLTSIGWMIGEKSI
jgi:hypothetical protein